MSFGCSSLSIFNLPKSKIKTFPPLKNNEGIIDYSIILIKIDQHECFVQIFVVYLTCTVVYVLARQCFV